MKNKLKVMYMENKIIFIVSILVIIFIMILAISIISHFNNDGMEQSGIKNVYYMTYSNNSWSKWSKNGITSGNINSDYPIKKIKIKLGMLEKESITYSIYNRKWSSLVDNNNSIKSQKIYGIRISGTENITKKYNICYRTYNKKNGWLEWSCNDVINGNSREEIYGLQIKIIPKNVIYNEYLKGYDINSNSKNIDF